MKQECILDTYESYIREIRTEHEILYPSMHLSEQRADETNSQRSYLACHMKPFGLLSKDDCLDVKASLEIFAISLETHIIIGKTSQELLKKVSKYHHNVRMHESI